MYKLSHLMLIVAVFLLAYSTSLVCIAAGWPGWVVLAVLVRVATLRKGRVLTTLASGRLATEEETRQAGMVNGKGLILGWLPKKNWAQRTKALFQRLPAKAACAQFMGKHELLTLPPSTCHVSVFGPTGAGKGASLIVPWLLSVNESAVVVDFKGELTRIAGAARRRMGRTVILDPFRVATTTPDSLNPLDCIIDKNSSRAPDDCKAFARAMVVRPEGAERNEHFYIRAEGRIAAMIATTVYFGIRERGTRSLVHVANLLSSPDAMKDAITLMRLHPEIWGGALSRMGGQMTFGAVEELASVTGTVTTAIDFMNTPEVAENLLSSTFDPRDLYRRKMTIFLVLPTEYMRSHSGLLRLWISSLVGVVIRGGL